MATPLQLWLEKKTYLEQQLAITSDATQKFALREQIKECEQEIVRLSNQPQLSTPNQSVIQTQKTISNKQLLGMKLTGQEKEQLQQALLDAFTPQSLKQMLTFKLDKDLDTITTANGFSNIVFDLITVANQEGWISQLITSAKEFNSGNQLLANLYTNLNKQISKNTQLSHLDTLEIPISIAHVIKPKMPIQPPGSPYKLEWYIHRLQDEELAFNSLIEAGSAVAIYAPSSFGKTTFIDYIIDQIEKGSSNLAEKDFSKSTIAKLNLAIHTTNEDESAFFKSFAYKIAQEISMDRKEVDSDWHSNHSPQSNLENFVLKVLKKEKNIFVLVIDNADEVWKYSSYSNSFWGLLSSWLNNANRKNWSKLRLILAISLPPNKLVTDISQSVFKTPSIKLEELSKKEIEELAIFHGLEWKDEEITQLMQKIGGHPYLARLVMYKAFSDPMNKENPKETLTRLLDHTKPTNRIFDNYLHKYETWLRKEKDICDEFLHFSDGKVKRPRSQSSITIDSLVKSGLLIQSESDFGLFSLRYELFKRLALKLAS